MAKAVVTSDSLQKGRTDQRGTRTQSLLNLMKTVAVSATLYAVFLCCVVSQVSFTAVHEFVSVSVPATVIIRSAADVAAVSSVPHEDAIPSATADVSGDALPYTPVGDTKQHPEVPSPTVDPLHNNVVMFAVSPGTTGTHAMFSATCHLGIPSIHYNLFCHNWKTDNSTILSAIHNPIIKKTLKLHQQVFGMFRRLQCHKDVPSCRSSPYEVHKFLNDMEHALTNILKINPAIALHDTPYPALSGLVEKVVKQARNHPPYLLLSERDPHKWASLRMRRYPEPLCRDNYDAIDYYGCIQRAIDRRKQQQQQQQHLVNVHEKDDTAYRSTESDSMAQQQPLYFVDVFVKFEKLRSLEGDPSPFIVDTNGIQHNRTTVYNGIVDSMRRRIEQYSNRSLYSIDLFEAEEKVPTEKIASDIGKALSASPSRLEEAWQLGPGLVEYNMYKLQKDQ